MGVALAGCSASLSKEDGCKEAAKFASESSSTLNNLTNNIGQQPSQGTFASRLGEIADEASQLNVADSELKKTLEDWSSAQKEIGEFFTDWEIGDGTESIIPAFDQFQIHNNKLIRICSL